MRVDAQVYHEKRIQTLAIQLFLRTAQLEVASTTRARLQTECDLPLQGRYLFHIMATPFWSTLLGFLQVALQFIAALSLTERNRPFSQNLNDKDLFCSGILGSLPRAFIHLSCSV